jgi:hypothetical protein
MATAKKSTLDRRVAVKTILGERGDTLLVTGLGSSCYDAGTLDHPNNYYTVSYTHLTLPTKLL